MSKKTKTPPATQTVIHVPLNKILPDPDNHRQSLNEAADFELAESIKEHGILQPITVRKCTDDKRFDYYVVFGHRRLRASKLAQTETIPCIVREISQEDVLEIQILENLQREDITPMDEALAFEKLLQKEKLDWLCAKIHKSKKYVNDRLKLVNLIAPGQQLLNADKLPLSHAILISKLIADDQKKVLDKCFAYINFENDIEDDDINEAVINTSLEDLKNYIDGLFTELSKAPFDTNDETLFVEAGACTNCLFRTKNSTLLFADITDEDKCTKVSCFKDKIDFHLKRAQLQAQEEHGGKKLQSAQIDTYFGRNTVKVAGQMAKYSELPGKGLTPVIITKTSEYEKPKLGKTVYVNLEPAVAKPSKKAQEVDVDIDWNENQAKDIETMVNYIVNAEFTPRTRFALTKLVAKQLLDKADLENILTCCNCLSLNSGVERGKEYSYSRSLSYNEKSEKKDEIIRLIVDTYGCEPFAIAVFCNLYDDELALADDDDDQYYEAQLTLTKFLKAINFLPPAKK